MLAHFDHVIVPSKPLFFSAINPSKTDIRKISKQILDRVNNTILEKKQSNPVEKHVFSYRMVPQSGENNVLL